MSDSAALTVTHLRAEQTEQLLGTEVARPRLSWQIEAAERGIVQAAYRLRAAASAEALAAGDALSWDSGTVAGNASFDIPYGGPPLASMQRLWWDVEITDDRGRCARSAPAWFETGLLSPGDWQADWIVAEDELAAGDRASKITWLWACEPLDPRPHAFRFEFDAPGDLVAAEVLVSGKDNLKGIWVNGDAATLPDRSYFGRQQPARGGWGTLMAAGDVTVRPGRNSLCALVTADPTGFYPVDGGAMAALIRLHRRDGTIERFSTGTSGWRVMPDAPEGWTGPDFDAAGWPAAQASGSRAQGDPRPPEPAMLLRTKFEARAPVVAARLYATALGAYEARINGRAVSKAVLAPEISVAGDHVLYQCYEVTALVAVGSNALGFTVADGFYAGAFGWRIERYAFGPAPRRLRAQLRLDYADGSSQWVTSGPDWRIATSPVIAADIYNGETYDARLERDGWDRAGYDDSGWRPAQVGATPTTRLVPQTSPLLEPRQVLRAKSISEPVPGRFVLDFGQNFPGWARLRVTGPAGTTITLRFAELLNPDGTADQKNLRRALCTDRYTLRGDADGETFEPRFTYHGFRYVEIEGFPGTPALDDIDGVIVHSACRETGVMTFADAPLLQRIWHNALWSQRSNFFAVPTDCPQRDERMGWMGDIQIFLDAAAFNMEVNPFIRRYLLEVRAAQRPDGGYPIAVPQPQSFPDVVTAGWSEAGVILPYGLWQRYGDTGVIDENWAAMEGWMGFVARNNPDHIWRNDRELDLGDWLSVDAVLPADETTPRVLCATAYWAYCADLMAEMATATGRAEAAERYRRLRVAIGTAFAEELVAPDGTASNGSQTSQVLSLYMGLVPADRRAAAAEVLAQDIRKRGMTLSTGFLGTPYLIDTLADAGCWEEVAALLLQTRYPSWGYMVAKDATTMWERWNGDVGDLSMNSYNHYAFGAVVGFFYRRLAGIAPAAPGFRRIAVRPVWLPQAGRVWARYESCVGAIETETGGDQDGLSSLSLTIPANTIAEVELPSRAWREGGRAIGDHPDVRNVAPAGDLVRFEVGSGRYDFTA